MKIEQIKNTQYKDVLELDRTIFDSKIALPIEEIQALTNPNVGKVFLAINDTNDILGYVFLQTGNSVYSSPYFKVLDDKELYVHTLGVSKDNQDSGVGRFLLKAVNEFAKLNSFKLISAKVHPDNINSLRVFTKYLGMKAIGIDQNAYGQKIDRLNLKSIVSEHNKKNESSGEAFTSFSTGYESGAKAFVLPVIHASNLDDRSINHDILVKIFDKKYECIKILKPNEWDSNMSGLLFVRSL